MKPWLLTPLCLAACTGGMQDPSTVEQQAGACIVLEDRQFESVNELECGRGTGTCRWRLTFATHSDESSTFSWAYSDVGESGQVSCEGAAITTSPRPLDASFDPVTQKLVWAGQTYRPAD